MAILVAYDGSMPAQGAATQAIETYTDEDIVFLRVIEVADSSTGAGIALVQDLLTERREAIAEESAHELSEVIDTELDRIHVETAVGKPAREIVRYAEEHDIDHIFIGNHGRSGVSRVLLGSVAERVVRRAPVPVTVVR